ncbi:glycosyltransferase [Roseivirga echinicomitans]|uniref:Glycosyl transferase family 1 domain-containing protein n=1 Tax=Roseivirga echinicomitans TaxID=296218 RepID=A0A150XR02_9BACT|nr:glycosyltransferase [Roseivirga echinicomitans]KYG81131.1 hypothetical protein AWN68_16465 [Roseivirga echinicomitans]
MFRKWLIYRLYRFVRVFLRESSDSLKKSFEKLEQHLLYFFYRYFVFKTIVTPRDHKPRVLFGPCPIINNKYWANALKANGYKADSIVTAVPIINSNEDFDILIEDLFPIKGKRNNWNITKQKLEVFSYILKEYDIFLMAFRFNFFDNTVFFKNEARLLKLYGKKVIIIPYGSDYYKYSKIIDQSFKHNLMISVPTEVFNEKSISEKVDYWTVNADFVIMAIMLDDAARWDALPLSVLCIDLNEWKPSVKVQKSDGHNGTVTIAHSPNFRGFKGTEFIIQAVQELKAEGLKIDFILLEKVKNEVVRSTLQEKADILVEQLILTGHGLNAIEGLASGIPVLSNLENPEIMNVFRRYSYLNECPIVSTSPENVKDNLRKLITNPELRVQLGSAGRKYAEKYHSYNAFNALFAEMEKKIWRDDPSSDPMNFFNPRNSKSYNNLTPLINHPLTNSHITND